MEFREDVYLGMRHRLYPPLMNGGGCCKTVEHVEELSQSLAGGIVLGSFTKDDRPGNIGNVWSVENGTGLNSLGMPNKGRDYLEEHLPEMVAIAHDREKALIVNVAGFNPSEYAILAATAFNKGADAVELNLGCPNVLTSDGARKPIASFNLEVMEEIICTVKKGSRR
jgi:dihydroorotate dehydrogenase